jgi:peptidoglycan/LPS O-acetylase OafA/YrhL
MADRYSTGFWIDTLKYTPLPYLCTFLAGLTLGRLHEALALRAHTRACVGLAGFVVAWFLAYHYTEHMPYVLVHGGLLTPVFAAIILGLAGPSWLASIFSVRPLVVAGASTYALYLLHFNVFLLLQTNHVWQRVGLGWMDPWISYAFVILLALAVRQWVEHPAQVAISGWWKQRKERMSRRALAVA